MYIKFKKKLLYDVVSIKKKTLLYIKIKNKKNK